MAAVFRWFGEQAKRLVEARARQIERKAADYLGNRARVHVPVDTGELRSSIIVIYGPGATTIMATADHAVPVEWGHMAGSTWVPPNPFMRRAIADTKAKFPSFVAVARF